MSLYIVCYKLLLALVIHIFVVVFFGIYMYVFLFLELTHSGLQREKNLYSLYSVTNCSERKKKKALVSCEAKTHFI